MNYFVLSESKKYNFLHFHFQFHFTSKTNNLLRSLLVDMKASSSLLMRFEIAGMAQTSTFRVITVVSGTS